MRKLYTRGTMIGWASYLYYLAVSEFYDNNIMINKKNRVAATNGLYYNYTRVCVKNAVK